MSKHLPDLNKNLTAKDFEDIVEKAIKNFGVPNQVFISSGSGFTAWGAPVELTHTYKRVLEHFVGASVYNTSLDYEVMCDAAKAFHNVGFDPKSNT